MNFPIIIVESIKKKKKKPELPNRKATIKGKDTDNTINNSPPSISPPSHGGIFAGRRSRLPRSKESGAVDDDETDVLTSLRTATKALSRQGGKIKKEKEENKEGIKEKSYEDTDEKQKDHDQQPASKRKKSSMILTESIDDVLFDQKEPPSEESSEPILSRSTVAASPYARPSLFSRMINQPIEDKAKKGGKGKGKGGKGGLRSTGSPIEAPIEQKSVSESWEKKEEKRSRHQEGEMEEYLTPAPSQVRTDKQKEKEEGEKEERGDEAIKTKSQTKRIPPAHEKQMEKEKEKSSVPIEEEATQGEGEAMEEEEGERIEEKEGEGEIEEEKISDEVIEEEIDAQSVGAYDEMEVIEEREEISSLEFNTGFEEGAADIEEIKESDAMFDEEKAESEGDDAELEESLRNIREQFISRNTLNSPPPRSLREVSNIDASENISAPSLPPPVSVGGLSSNRRIRLNEIGEQSFIEVLPLFKKRYLSMIYSKYAQQIKPYREMLDRTIRQHSAYAAAIREETKLSYPQKILNDSKALINKLTNAIQQLVENTPYTASITAKKTIEKILHQMKLIHNQLNKTNNRAAIQSIFNEFNQEFQGLIDDVNDQLMKRTYNNDAQIEE